MAVLRSAVALAVAFPVYVFALLYYGSRVYQPFIKVVGISVALLGGYLAGLIGGRRRWPVVHAGVPATMFPWVFLADRWGCVTCPLGVWLSAAMDALFLTLGALLGGYLARPRREARKPSGV